MTTKLPEVACPYCGRAAELLRDSTPLYGRDYGPVWRCTPCAAWVGVHKNSARFVPLGRLADAELRAAKQRAHAAFDPLWKCKAQRDGLSKSKARGLGYAWLAEQLGIERSGCHIGMFDVTLCNRVVDVCSKHKPKEQ